MPSLVSHYIVGNRVLENINKSFRYNKFENVFKVGSVFPDYISKDKHYRVKGTYFDVPSIDLFLNDIKKIDEFNCGYLVHLLLDYYFSEVYLPSLNVININVFTNGGIYKDYDVLNKLLVDYFDVDVFSLEYLLVNYDIDKSKFEYDINCIKGSVVGDLKYIEVVSYIKFLEDISLKISKDILKIINN